MNPPPTRSSPWTRVALAAALDLAAIVIFVAIGRQEHDDGTETTPYIEVLAPFAIGLVVAWSTSRAWRRPFTWQSGVGVCAITVLLGMILRKSMFGDGTAVAFILVATGFLGLTIVGWRLIAARIVDDG